MQFRSLFVRDFLGMLKSTPFIIIMTLGLVQMITALTFVTSMYGNTTYPVTYNVVDVLRGSISFYMLIIVAFYAGQLVWKERDPKIDGIVDALPMATRTNLLAKVSALVALVFVVHVIAALAGMATQLLHGYTRLQPAVYLTYFVLAGTLAFGFWAVLAILVHVLVNNKYMGYFVFILVFVLNLFAWSALNVESNLVAFNGTSGLTYSDMNGFGPFLKGWLFFKSYWTVFGACCYTRLRVHVRGNETNMALALAHGEATLGRFWAVAAMSGRGVRAVGGLRLLQHQGAEHLQVGEEQEELQGALREGVQAVPSKMPQPHYTDLSFFIDMDPEARALSYTVDIKLKNKSNVAIDTLYFNVPHRMDVKMDIPGAELVLNDEALDQRMYRLATPLAPGARVGD
jgi:ABC-2 type transport system permease protein